ncbi:hypothetical protein OL229_21510 [Neisseriaceae bacterium JH1-16]|nr:hypothetical protein [Neisseriaceae bacterium JH1-16]
MNALLTRLRGALARLGLASLALLLAAGAGYGYGFGQGQARTAADAQLATLHRDIALAQAAAQERELRLAERGDALAARLARQQLADADATAQLKRSLDRVSTVYRPAPDAPLQPLPRCVFTRGFVGVLNTAIGAEPVPAADPAGAAAAETDTAGATDSGVSQADLLDHLTDYGQRCRRLEHQLDALIDWLHPDKETPP